jgi:hypothetical protein
MKDHAQKLGRHGNIICHHAPNDCSYLPHGRVGSVNGGRVSTTLAAVDDSERRTNGQSNKGSITVAHENGLVTQS